MPWVEGVGVTTARLSGRSVKTSVLGGATQVSAWSALNGVDAACFKKRLACALVARNRVAETEKSDVLKFRERRRSRATQPV